MSDDNAIARRMNLMRLLSVRRLGATIDELAPGILGFVNNFRCFFVD